MRRAVVAAVVVVVISAAGAAMGHIDNATSRSADMLVVTLDAFVVAGRAPHAFAARAADGGPLTVTLHGRVGPNRTSAAPSSTGSRSPSGSGPQQPTSLGLPVVCRAP
jgi:hypothetical protein